MEPMLEMMSKDWKKKKKNGINEFKWTKNKQQNFLFTFRPRRSTSCVAIQTPINWIALAIMPDSFGDKFDPISLNKYVMYVMMAITPLHVFKITKTNPIIVALSAGFVVKFDHSIVRQLLFFVVWLLLSASMDFIFAISVSSKCRLSSVLRRFR